MSPRISVAPMVDVTNRHYRYLCRLFSRKTFLYTPMIVDRALLMTPNSFERYLHYDPVEHPLIAQLGGSDPEHLVPAALACQELGFEEVNLNLGCPASSATAGAYGAQLMFDHDRQLAHTLRALTDAVDIPVTVKCRVGVDDHEGYDFLRSFVDRAANTGGVGRFIIHARKALLNLNTKDNRKIPTLQPELAYQLKRDFPDLRLEFNGEVRTEEDIRRHLAHGMDGCMLGRRVMDNPAFLSCVDGLLARVQEEQGREGGGEEGDGDNGGDGDGGRQGGVGSVCHASPSAASSLPPLTLRRVLYDYASYVDAYEEWCAKHSCRREDVFAGNPNPNWLIMPVQNVLSSLAPNKRVQGVWRKALADGVQAIKHRRQAGGGGRSVSLHRAAVVSPASVSSASSLSPTASAASSADVMVGEVDLSQYPAFSPSFVSEEKAKGVGKESNTEKAGGGRNNSRKNGGHRQHDYHHHHISFSAMQHYNSSSLQDSAVLAGKDIDFAHEYERAMVRQGAGAILHHAIDQLEQHIRHTHTRTQTHTPSHPPLSSLSSSSASVPSSSSSSSSFPSSSSSSSPSSVSSHAFSSCSLRGGDGGVADRMIAHLLDSDLRAVQF